MNQTNRGLGRSSQIVAALGLACATSALIGQHAQAAKSSTGVKKDGMIPTHGAGRDEDAGNRASAKPAAAQGRDWTEKGPGSAAQKAMADAGAFAKKAVASGQARFTRQNHAAMHSSRASWRTRSRHLWSTSPVN